MRATILFFSSCLAAVCIPLATVHIAKSEKEIAFTAWPETFEGRALHPIKADVQTLAFEKRFPGKVGHFTDGTRQIVFRWISRASRKVHAAADCYRGIGYTVTEEAMFRDTDTVTTWNCFIATRDQGEAFSVRECYRDTAGQTFPDVSSWYWAAFQGKTAPPWYAITVVETVP